MKRVLLTIGLILLFATGGLTQTTVYDNSGFQVADVDSRGNTWSSLPTSFLCRVTGVHATADTTTITVETTIDIGQVFSDLSLDNLFNDGWGIAPKLCTNISTGLGIVVDITDYTVNTGVLVTEDPGAAYAIGDVLMFAVDEFTGASSKGYNVSTGPAVTMVNADTTAALFTTTGNILIHELIWEVTTLTGAAVDSACFIIDSGVGTSIIRVDRGGVLNTAIVGTMGYVASSTIGTNTTVVAATTGAPAAWHADWGLFVNSGSEIKIRNSGANVTGALTPTVIWEPLEAGASIIVN